MIEDGMDWPRVLSLLAHELRSPAGVIAGYARMLGEGRLSAADQARAYAQIDRAASRITAISRQAGDLARWLEPDVHEEAVVPLGDLLTRAIAQTASPARITLDPCSKSQTIRLPVLDHLALAGAIAASADAICRELHEDQVHVSVAADPGLPSCDILLGSAPALASYDARASGDPSPTEWSTDRGGLGLAPVLAAAVVLAHGGQLSSVGDRHDILVIRLRTCTGDA